MKIYKFTDTIAPKAIFTIEELKEKYNHRFIFGLDNLMHSGIFKLLGWAYDMREDLNLYIVKQYGYIQEYYAPNKTQLRKLLSGKIDYIKQI